jgi:hypothetical protein
VQVEPQEAASGRREENIPVEAVEEMGGLLVFLPFVLVAVLVAVMMYTGAGMPRQGTGGKRPWSPAFIQRWEDNRIESRINEIVQLENAGGAEAVPRLVRLLRDRNAAVRAWAASALGASKDPRAVELMIAARWCRSLGS